MQSPSQPDEPHQAGWLEASGLQEPDLVAPVAEDEQPETGAAPPRTGATEVVAGVFILLCVVLHVVAMTQTYFKGQATLASQTDQAVLYSVLAAAWLVAFVLGLFGPDRVVVTAGIAVGLAATEFGFRVSDLGGAIQAGGSRAGSGLWIMTAAWIAGAAGAALLVVAARSRSVRRRGGVQGGDGRYERTAGWTAGVAVLGLATAALYLPPWDHYELTATATGLTKSLNLGNGLQGPWSVVLGNVLVSSAIFLLAIGAMLLRHRGAGAALVVGSLVALGSQMASAVVQVDQPVSPAAVGLSQSTVNQLGVVIKASLTGWFALEALVALVLLASVTFWASARVVQENSSGTLGTAPAASNAAMPSAS
jgi:hypothetical protein